jgi:spore germination cell wall hydrolase CwlJ-like protein
MTGKILCLAVAIFFEARGEPIDGNELVANINLNKGKT